MKLGKYTIKHKIGEGAFAEVRLAVDDETQQEYAVKIFQRPSVPRSQFDQTIRKEIRIMQYLRHPNIVHVQSVMVTTCNLYMFMELVRGGELYDEIVSKQRIDEDTSRRYFQQIVDAMVYCHRRGVVHRDLKPENLLLDGKGNVKITDFGMSWVKERIDSDRRDRQLLRTQCGTPKYMAPEIISRPSDGYDGEKIDAWECGMVLYALLAGRLPFYGETDDAVFRAILKGRLRFPKHFSLGARDVLTELLEKDPERRASLEDIRRHHWFLHDYFGDEVRSRQEALRNARPEPLKSLRVQPVCESSGMNDDDALFVGSDAAPRVPAASPLDDDAAPHDQPDDEIVIDRVSRVADKLRLSATANELLSPVTPSYDTRGGGAFGNADHTPARPPPFHVPADAPSPSVVAGAGPDHAAQNCVRGAAARPAPPHTPRSGLSYLISPVPPHTSTGFRTAQPARPDAPDFARKASLQAAAARAAPSPPHRKPSSMRLLPARRRKDGVQGDAPGARTPRPERRRFPLTMRVETGGRDEDDASGARHASGALPPPAPPPARQGRLSGGAVRAGPARVPGSSLVFPSGHKVSSEWGRDEVAGGGAPQKPLRMGSALRVGRATNPSKLVSRRTFGGSDSSSGRPSVELGAAATEARSPPGRDDDVSPRKLRGALPSPFGRALWSMRPKSLAGADGGGVDEGDKECTSWFGNADAERLCSPTTPAKRGEKAVGGDD